VANNKQSEFYTSYKISNSFRIFLIFFIIIGLIFTGYLLFRTGENLQNVIKLIIGAAGGITLILWLMTVGIKKIRDSEKLSDTERSYIEDLGHHKITGVIKKYVFSNMDISEPLRFIVVMGWIIKWMLFSIFSGGMILLLFYKHTSLDIALFLFLIVVWCPWIENIFLKKINFKITFIVKLLTTISIFLAGIISQG